MAEEATNIQEIKTSSDGTVKLAIEKYNEMVDKIASQTLELREIRGRLQKALNDPPRVVNQTVVEKTPEMLARESKLWGGSVIGLGACLIVVGALHMKNGSIES